MLCMARCSSQSTVLTSWCHTDFRRHLGDTSTSPTKQAGPWVLGRTLKIGSSLVKGRANKAVVTPVLKYASSIWHPNNINLINRLESVQQKAAWWTPQRCCKISSVNNMLTTLGWPYLQHRCRKARLVNFYKFHHHHGSIATDTKWIPGDYPSITRAHHSHSPLLGDSAKLVC